MGNSSRIFIGALAIVVVIVLIFAFTQFQAVNTTQGELADAEAALTQSAADAEATSSQLADTLAAANAEATESLQMMADTATEAAETASAELESANVASTVLAEDAAATSTQSSVELANANATSTERAASMEVMQNNLRSTATRAAVDAADNLLLAEATAEANAQALVDLAAEATTAANDTATQNAINLAEVREGAAQAAEAAASIAAEQATAIADAQATNAAQATSQTTILQGAGTQAAELESARIIIDAQSTIIAETFTNRPPEGFANYSVPEFEMLIPDNFRMFDLRSEQETAVDTFNSLGADYAIARSIAQGGSQVTTIIGARDTVEEGFADLLLITTQDVASDTDIATYFENANVTDDDAGVVPLEQEILPLDDREVGFLLYDNDFLGTFETTQFVYIYIVDDQAYLLTYVTLDSLVDEQRGQFQVSGLSFAPR